MNPMHHPLISRSCCCQGPGQSSALPVAETQAALDLLQQEKRKRGTVCSRTALSRGLRPWLLAGFVRAPQAASEPRCPERLWDAQWRHLPRAKQLLWARGSIPGAVPPLRQEVDGSTRTAKELSTCLWQDLVTPTPRGKWGEISPRGFARCLGGR